MQRSWVADISWLVRTPLLSLVSPPERCGGCHSSWLHWVEDREQEICCHPRSRWEATGQTPLHTIQRNRIIHLGCNAGLFTWVEGLKFSAPALDLDPNMLARRERFWYRLTDCYCHIALARMEGLRVILWSTCLVLTVYSILLLFSYICLGNYCRFLFFGCIIRNIVTINIHPGVSKIMVSLVKCRGKRYIKKKKPQSYMCGLPEHGLTKYCIVLMLLKQFLTPF